MLSTPLRRHGAPRMHTRGYRRVVDRLEKEPRP